jgi:hypothetical protein
LNHILVIASEAWRSSGSAPTNALHRRASLAMMVFSLDRKPL